MAGPGDEKGTDAASFASILDNVRRMREQYDVGSIEKEPLAVSNELSPELVTTPETVNPPIVSTDSGKQLSSSRKRSLNDNSPNAAHSASSNKTASDSTSMDVTSSMANSLSSRPSDAPLNPTPRPIAGPRKHVASYSLADILVHKSQQGNPLFEESAMKVTPWKFDSKVLCDYYISPKVQILFLSLKYHKIRPEYLWHRLKKLNKGLSSTEVAPLDSVLRILLVVVDVESHHEVIRDLLVFCVKHDMLLVLSWLFAEAGNYIVMAKQNERAPAKLSLAIRGVRGSDYQSSMVEALTGIRRINKTDVSNLLANYKSAKTIVLKSTDPLESGMSAITGLGETKIKNLRLVFLEPFIYNKVYD